MSLIFSVKKYMTLNCRSIFVEIENNNSVYEQLMCLRHDINSV